MISCAVIVSFLGCIATSYLFVRFALPLEIPFVRKLWFCAAFLSIGCLPLFSGYKFEPLFKSFYPFYRHALYFIFIWAVVLLTISILRDVIWGGALMFGAPKMTNQPLLIKTNKIVFVVSFLATISSLLSGILVPRVKMIVLESEKIKTEQKIVFLSDIHIHRVISSNKIKGIVQKTNELNPDYILLGGDIVDDQVSKIQDDINLLKDFKAKGIYYAPGNHEFYIGLTAANNSLDNLGMKRVMNDGVSLGDLFVGGIPDYSVKGKVKDAIDLDKTFAEATEDQYKILISHTPFIPEQKIDLVLSGHTHGGQIFPFHILERIVIKFVAGFYDLPAGGKLYISRGAGQWGPQMRFLAPAEITEILLKPKKSEENSKK